MNNTQCFTTRRLRAFTLVELMLAMVVLSLIMILATSVMTQTQKTWLQASARSEQFREARAAFEQITQKLRQATLNTYHTYEYNDGASPTVPEDKSQGPRRYIRHSELQFATGAASFLLAQPSKVTPGHAVFFQGTTGVTQRDGYEMMNRLLCGQGYFVMYGDDAAYRPEHVSQSRTRFRLMEYRPPAEKNGIYSANTGDWFKDAASQVVTTSETVENFAYTRPMTENIIGLFISPRVSPADVKGTGKKQEWLAPYYAFDSTLETNVTPNSIQGTQHLLPPLVQVTLVAIDEASARRLEEKSGSAAPNLVPSGAFTNVAGFSDDLKSLEEELVKEKLNYRVFSATIALRNSKWAMYGN